MALSKRTRFEVLRRDNHTCRYCGGTAPDVMLTVDHVTPVSLGGSDDPSNLVAACKDCNAGKASTSPDEHHVAQVSDQALRWSGAIEYAAERMLDDLEAYHAVEDRFATAWSDTPHTGWKPPTCPGDWRDTLHVWVAQGMPETVIHDALRSSFGRSQVQPDQKYRYMCGIVWAKLRKLQETAHDMLAQEDAATEAGPAEAVSWIGAWGRGFDVGRACGPGVIIQDFIDRRDSQIVRDLTWVAAS
jgi:hypothetical protein